ncbi:MAG: adenylyltransferase/cytidyltransferase family protein [Patescibacteria group bacterium]|jgi:cytidyltransferase-like protein
MSKIVVFSDLHKVVDTIRYKNKSIVLVTGVFDLLHKAHIEFLRRAKAQGDFLFVGVESDERVKQLKGPDRPCEPLPIRLAKLAKREETDYVFALPVRFNNPSEHEKLMAMIAPNVLAVSSHTPFKSSKKRLVEKFGGKMEVVMEQDTSVSTTKLLGQGEKRRTLCK